MTRFRTLFAILLASLFVLPVLADEVADDLAEARKLIDSKRFDEAARILEAALPRTASLPDDAQPQAQVAVHFYAGVAYSALDRDEEALDHIRQVLELAPEIRRVDPSKYDAHFVELFTKARGSEAFGSFEDFYPGYKFQTEKSKTPLGASDHAPALEILATRAEKRDWKDAGREERERLIAEFWHARDPNPETRENEFREAFEHRVHFADAAFASATERGSLTDRGRVFSVLGEPARVRRRAITSRDNILSMNTAAIGIIDGTIEYWIYTREQFRMPIPQKSITFRFVSHPGVGDNIMQRDGMAMNALGMAVKTAREN